MQIFSGFVTSLVLNFIVKPLVVKFLGVKSSINNKLQDNLGYITVVERSMGGVVGLIFDDCYISKINNI